MLDQDLLPLTTPAVRLRPLRYADAAAYAEGTDDPQVREFAHLPAPQYTAESVRTMIDEVAGLSLERGDLVVLTIADPATDTFVGSLVLFDVSEDSAEVGFWIHPAHRGAGRAAAALELAAELAARSGLSRLTARTVPANAATRSLLARAAFAAGPTTRSTAPSGVTSQMLTFSRRVDATAHLPLVTERLVLRLHTDEDAAGLQRIYSRPDVARLLLEEPWSQQDAQDQIIRRRRRTGLETGEGQLAAVVEHEGRVIGDVALWVTDREHRLAEIGWVLDPDHGGRGLATEAVRAILDLAFESYRVHRVAAQMDARNEDSARLAQRVGMRREAHLRQDWWSKGEWTDTVIFAMLAADR